MMQLDKKLEIKGINGSILLIVILVVAAFLIFLPAIVLRAEEPVQMANIGQYDNLLRYQPVPENDGSAENLSVPKNDSSMPDGIDAVSCAVFGNIPVVIEGPTELEFWWRGSETGVMIFTLNGRIKAVQYKDNGWQKYKLSINEQGTQYLKWIYKNTAEAQAAIRLLDLNS